MGSLRRKSRYKLKKERRERGKVSISRFMQSFSTGQRVYLSADSSMHKGCYPQRFLGKSGIVKSQKGKCYEVMINDKGKEKLLIVNPVHLKTRRD